MTESHANCFKVLLNIGSINFFIIWKFDPVEMAEFRREQFKVRTLP